MKTEFTDVSETRKTLTIEIPTDVVDAEIARIARDYTKQARIPGFRPGKVPTTLVKQRFRDQIMHDVMHGLIPRAVEEALQERGIEPIDTPNIKDVDRRRPAAEVHGQHRDRPIVRSGRPFVAQRHPRIDRRQRRRRGQDTGSPS